MITRERLVQEDGAVWARYGIDGGAVTLTSLGQQLLHECTDVWPMLRDYRKRVLGSRAVRTTARREFMGHGDHAKVYYMTDRLVVKESVRYGVDRSGNTYSVSLQDALARMDRLYDVVKHGKYTDQYGDPQLMPKWLNMPAHYGVLETENLDRQYMLMECVDSGITVADILRPAGEDPTRDALIRREFGELTPEDIEEVTYNAYYGEAMIRSALNNAGLDDSVYLGDLHDRNVLVERAPEPIEGSNFKLWVIDQ